MTNKKRWIFISFGIVAIVATTIIYWLYFSKPTSFPSDEQLIEDINSLFPEAAARTIQDIIQVDERNVLVPFISNSDDYSLSYWVWHNHRWQVKSIDTKGQAMLWKINENDPSSYYFVWNIHPLDQLSSIQFYFIRDRGFHQSNDIGSYSPRIQMAKEVSLEKKSYGILQLPEEWVSVINSLIEGESGKQHDLYRALIFNQSAHFGWVTFNHNGKISYPDLSVNGNGFSNGIVELEHPMILDQNDLEFSTYQYE